MKTLSVLVCGGLLVYLVLAVAQTPTTGKVVVIPRQIQAFSATGQLVCTATELTAGLEVTCKYGNQSWAFPVPALTGDSGHVMSSTIGADSITWLVKKPATGPLYWEVVANGFLKKSTDP